MNTAMLGSPKRSSALLGSKTKAEIIRVLLSASRLSISELARRANLSKSATRQALPQLAEAGIITLTDVGRERQAELVARWRPLAEGIVALDAPILPAIKEEMSTDDLEKVALYFAMPSAAPARADDWDGDQRALPVTAGVWKGRAEP